jgi:rhomboid protease GluP
MKAPVAPPPGVDWQFQQTLLTYTPRLIATPAIVVGNIIVFVAMIACGVNMLTPETQDFIKWGANFGPKTMDGQWWRLITHMFLHFGILHIGFNMWVLWNLGRLMERLVGNTGFVLLYSVSGIAGGIASLAWNPGVVSAGASGAVFGVGGALLGFLLLRRDTIPIEALKPLRNSMLTFLAYNLIFGLVVPGIDMAAHVGGLVTGFVCGLALSQPLSAEMPARRRPRNLAVLVGGILVLPIAAYSLPGAPPDVARELDGFVEMESRVLTRFQSLMGQAQRGEIRDEQLADRLKSNVLAPWTAGRKKVEELLDSPLANKPYLSRLVQYMKLREQGWQLQIEGLREQDVSKFAQGNEKLEEANAMAAKLASSESP